MNILVVEDEFTLAARLERLIRDIVGERITSLKVLGNLDDADDYINENVIDLLFLDLNLQSRDGFQLLRQSVAASFHTVVVSANTHRAIEAFEYGVLDFVPKPFTKVRLSEALDRYGSSSANTRANSAAVKFLTIKKKGRLEMFDIQSIKYIKGANNYSELYFDNNTTELHSKSLTKLSEILPNRFLRVHKSYIVSMDRVCKLESIKNANYQIVINCGDVIPVSRSKAKELRHKY